MADKAPIALTFNGKPISAEDALKMLIETYGERRAKEIPGQLADGTHGCASVKTGWIELAKPE